MSKPTLDFFSSFGMMLLGVMLVGGSSVVFAKGGAAQPRLFPVAQPRPAPAAGGDLESLILPVSRPRVPVRLGAVFSGPLSAPAVLVVDDETNAVLLEKNSNVPRPLASLTKLASALVLNSLGLPWAATTTVLAEDVDSSSHHLFPGEILTLEELWHVALIGSSNSAIESLVRESTLTPPEFVERMNALAGALHLPTAQFSEPTGLSQNNVASAWDTARLLKEALLSPHVARPLSIGEYYVRPRGAPQARRIWSTNWLLNDWVENDFGSERLAGKTGYIAESGYNFAARFGSATGHRVRVVVLGSGTNESRFSEARDLAKWAFENYVWPDDPRYAKAVE